MLTHLVQKLLTYPVVALVLWDIENVAHCICALLRLAIVTRHYRNSIFVGAVHKVYLRWHSIELLLILHLTLACRQWVHLNFRSLRGVFRVRIIRAVDVT